MDRGGALRGALDVRPEPGQGTFDLLTFFGNLSTGFDQVAIRREITVTGDLDLGTIDATAVPVQAMIPMTFTAPNVDPAEAL